MTTKTVATIDLGSNSFHMMIINASSVIDHRVVARYKQKVQLRAGILPDGTLDQETKSRALLCFTEFAAKLAHHQVEAVDIVGTYTLRAAIDIDDFLQQAEIALGQPIRIISGQEEARLIYVGASLSTAHDDKELVLDIGGGSTEIIIGQSKKALLLNSLDMGCVSLQQRFFASGNLNQTNFDDAIYDAKQLIEPHLLDYLKIGWNRCIGTSGTVLAIASIVLANFKEETITLSHLQWIKSMCCNFESVDAIRFDGLRADRENILPGGLSILIALFESFQLDQLNVSSSAIREGVLHEFLSSIFY